MKLFVALFLLLSVNSGTGAQPESGCSEVHTMVQIARATTVKQLETARLSADADFRVRAVYVFRKFELMPADHGAASTVLDLLPKRDDDPETYLGLGTEICPDETDVEIAMLAALEDRRAHEWARAVILLPERMADYVAYPVHMGLNPHDDYAVQMRKVCRAHHEQFSAAIKALPDESRIWYLKHVFNPQGCRILGYPEAD